MSDFKKCENGHVYDSGLKECPYCGGETIDQALKKQADEKPDARDERFEKIELAMCYDMGPRSHFDIDKGE